MCLVPTIILCTTLKNVLYPERILVLVYILMYFKFVTNSVLALLYILSKFCIYFRPIALDSTERLNLLVILVLLVVSRTSFTFTLEPESCRPTCFPIYRLKLTIFLIV